MITNCNSSDQKYIKLKILNSSEEFIIPLKMNLEIKNLKERQDKLSDKFEISYSCESCTASSKTSKIYRCKKCNAAWYCSKKCQKKHWLASSGHYENCGKKDCYIGLSLLEKIEKKKMEKNIECTKTETVSRSVMKKLIPKLILETKLTIDRNY